ncbi:hypothetical protein AHAS_Ahas20G0180400 [Arachis hypogaea]
MREARELELMQLKQEYMTMAQFTNKFEELYRFSRVCQGAPKSYEGWKCISTKEGSRASDAHGTNNDRRHGEFFQPKGQNFKKDGHAPQHPQGQGNFRGANYDQLCQMRGRGICFNCALPGHISKDCCRGKNYNASRNQQPSQVFSLDTRDVTGSDPPMRGKRILWV